MVKILDTTLRDGSYVTNFQFDARDTFIVANALDEAGIHFIEVGHGLGMNAGSFKSTMSPCSDEAYLDACHSAIEHNKWGMFFIPGIGRKKDLEIAAKYGMDFVRIGTDVTQVEQAEPYIRQAKDLGMYVASNFMKTYALEFEEVGRKAALAEKYGADIICIVDSAGGMLPEDVSAYYNSIREQTSAEIGFHGHNNMGMAVANAMQATDLGCTVIDTSLRGIGRSSGNVVTEIFLLALKRRGIITGVDITRILDLAETFADPLLENYKQVDSIGIVSGYAQFHSSYLSKIFDYAGRYHVDPRELIIRVSAIDKIDASDELVERISVDLAHQKTPEVSQSKVGYHSHLLSNPSDIIASATEIAVKAHSLAKKYNSISVFNLVQSYRPGSSNITSSVINEGPEFVICSAEVSSAEVARNIATAIDGKVDFILIDIDIKSSNSESIRNAAIKNIKGSSILLYSDLNAWSDAVITLLNHLAGATYDSNSVKLIGDNMLSKYLLTKLKGIGISVSLESALRDKYDFTKDILIYCEPAAARIPNECQGMKIIDAIVGSFSESEILKLLAQNASIWRVDMQSQVHSLVGNLISVMERSKLDNDRSILEFEGTPFTGGGIVAPRGTVIVDSLSNPKRVLGIADGRGMLIHDFDLDDRYRRCVNKIKSAIYKRSIKL